jgi:hypothetical protein
LDERFDESSAVRLVRREAICATDPCSAAVLPLRSLARLRTAPTAARGQLSLDNSGSGFDEGSAVRLAARRAALNSAERVFSPGVQPHETEFP